MTISRWLFPRYFRAFARPIYAFLWNCWFAIVAALIGASDFRYQPVGGQIRGVLLWAGIIGFIFQAAVLVRLTMSKVGREWLMNPIPDRISGRTTIMLWSVALIGGVAVVVVWTK